MGKTYRAYLPEQKLLLPPSLQDWLPENHLVYFVSNLVNHRTCPPSRRSMKRSSAGSRLIIRG